MKCSMGVIGKKTTGNKIRSNDIVQIVMKTNDPKQFTKQQIKKMMDDNSDSY